MTVVEAESAPAPKLIASRRHLLVVIVILAVIAVRGMTMKPDATDLTRVAAHAELVYASLILMEVALVYLVWRGIRSTGTTISELVGGRWSSARNIIRDIALGIILWMVLIGVVYFSNRFAHSNGLPGTVAALLPRTAGERAVWVVLSISAGFAEEILYRGYLQRQFESLTNNRWIALVLQSILFGVSHGYQGIGAMVRITVLGVAFGLMAIWRRSLRPGMIAHAWTDAASGIFHPG